MCQKLLCDLLFAQSVFACLRLRLSPFRTGQSFSSLFRSSTGNKKAFVLAQGPLRLPATSASKQEETHSGCLLSGLLAFRTAVAARSAQYAGSPDRGSRHILAALPGKTCHLPERPSGSGPFCRTGLGRLTALRCRRGQPLRGRSKLYSRLPR